MLTFPAQRGREITSKEEVDDEGYHQGNVVSGEESLREGEIYLASAIHN